MHIDDSFLHENRNIKIKVSKTHLSTHILQEVPEVADRIILINNGRLIFEGTPDEVKGESSLDAWFNKQTLAA